MKSTFKVSGKKVSLPESASGWSFQKRPGGWVIAVSPAGERRRIMITEIKGKLSASLFSQQEGHWGRHLWHGDISENRTQGASGGGSDSDLIAQFPGKVRKILVAEGAEVQEGDSLVLVEAMKMEFAIKAPFAGTISKLLVKEGQQLSPGDRFVDLRGKNGS